MNLSAEPKPMSRRNKLLTQLLAFIALAVLLYVGPKIEAWVTNSQTGPVDQSTASADVEPVPTGAKSRRSNDTATIDAKLPGSPQLPSIQMRDDSAALTVEKKQSTGSRKSDRSDPTSTSSGNTSDKNESRAGNKEKANGEQPTESDFSPKESDPSVADSDTSEQPKSDATKPTQKKSNSSKKSSSITPMNRDAAPKRTAGGADNGSTSKDDSTSADDPEWGKLKEIRDNVFESTAGLIYRSGSADGHRLKHVMQHAKDNTSKPVHGVFMGEGDRDVVLGLIDEAFDKTKKGNNKDVRREEQGDRLVFTINMKREVGFMGGQEGERRGNPECRFIRIVLENENEVISAFPTNR